MLGMFLLMAYVGIFTALFGIVQVIASCFMFLNYKRHNGKLSFKEYKRRYEL